MSRPKARALAQGGTIKPTEQITIYFHCKECLKEIPKNTSPAEYQRIQVGWTEKGIQVWCRRHDIQVVHLDFLKQKVAYA